MKSIAKAMQVVVPLLLALLLMMISTGTAMAAPPTHNPKHCDAAFAKLVASGKAGPEYYFNGSTILAKVGDSAPIVLCVLEIVATKVAAEKTTFTVLDSPTRTAAEYVKKQILARKAIYTTAAKIKAMGLRVIPRAPTLLVITYALCEQVKYDHSWLPMNMKIQCGFVKAY